MSIPNPTPRSAPDARPPLFTAASQETAHDNGNGNGNGNGARAGALHMVDPLDLFTGLAAALVPTFCDALRLDLAVDDGDSVKVSYGPATSAPDVVGQLDTGTLAGHSTGAGRIVIAVQSEPVAGESPIAGTVTCTWLDQTRPTEVDAVVARLLADQAVAKIRIESLTTSLEKQRERAANLEQALATNREIGQAIGILMATDHVTAAQAFERLRVASQHAHRKLREIAAEVTETGGLADSSEPATRLRADPSTARRQQRAAQRSGPADTASWPHSPAAAD